MGITELLLNFFVHIIQTGGYAGIVFLMALESMVAPVPSEAVMPFAGFLWQQGEFNLWLIILFSTVGSIIGSLISYYIGYFGGRPLVTYFGRFLLLNERHLIKTENFFNRFGGKAVFISRFIPVVRHLISIPAGAGKMNVWKFSAYTIIGAGIWNSLLTYLGYWFGNSWQEIRKSSEIIDIILIILIMAAAGWWILKRRKEKQ